MSHEKRRVPKKADRKHAATPKRDIMDNAVVRFNLNQRRRETGVYHRCDICTVMTLIHHGLSDGRVVCGPCYARHMSEQMGARQADLVYLRSLPRETQKRLRELHTVLQETVSSDSRQAVVAEWQAIEQQYNCLISHGLVWRLVQEEKNREKND